MMSDLVRQHFHEPCFIGILPAGPKVIRVEIDSPATSRHIIFSIEVEQSRIVQARHLVRGCPYTIATFSYLANWCYGQMLVNLTSMTRAFLIDQLSLPATKVHCAAMAEDTLRQLYLQWENT